MTTPTPKQIRKWPTMRLIRWLVWKLDCDPSPCYANAAGAIFLECSARDGILKGFRMTLHSDGTQMRCWWSAGRSQRVMDRLGIISADTELESRLRALALALVAAGGDK